MLSKEPAPISGTVRKDVIPPETIFRGHDENYSKNVLTKLFRRYSRCEDALLPPEMHVKAIKDRFNMMLARAMDKPVLRERLCRQAWAFAELDMALKTGHHSTVDIGLEDKTLIQTVFHDVRNAIKPMAVDGRELKRA